VDGWSQDEPEEIMVGDRRMRVRRRMPQRSRSGAVIVLAAFVVLTVGGVGLYKWLNRPTGFAALPNPAIVAPGGFRASIGANRTITVSLEIRNISKVDLSVTSATLVAPAGLKSTVVTLIAPGELNQGLALDGDLPAMAPIRLGHDGPASNGFVAARFAVNCVALPAGTGPTGERIFVTVQLGNESRQEELTPPVVGTTPWLTATARRACSDPAVAPSPPKPLEPLPSASTRA
jgi:hypothetical protein